MKNWLEAARPFSLTAAIIPVLVGLALALSQHHSFNLLNFVVVLAGGVLLQVGTNMINDGYDYRRGVDTPLTPRASRVVIDGRLPAAAVIRGGLVVFAIALVLGIILAVRVGSIILIPVVIGILLGWGYTAPPLEYKYRALGIPVVFLTMGPLMTWASYLGNGGHAFWLPCLVALPVAFLVAAIMHANDLRDIDDDASARVRTISGAVGFPAARRLYDAMLLLPYIVVLLAVLSGVISAFSLLAFLTLPFAWKNFNLARQSGRDHLATLDQGTAKLHLLFGLLFAIGLVVL